jgi:hypothetical protein
VIVIQESLLAALHEQPLPAVTEKVPTPPVGGKDWPAEESEYPQGACPAWVTVKVWPARAIVALLSGPLLAATE